MNRKFFRCECGTEWTPLEHSECPRCGLNSLHSVYIPRLGDSDQCEPSQIRRHVPQSMWAHNAAFARAQAAYDNKLPRD